MDIALPAEDGCGGEVENQFALRECFLMGMAGRANMGRHIMKTTIEIADALFERAQRVARKENTTFRALTEQGLRLVLKEKQAKRAHWKWKPVVVKGSDLNDEFKNASWEKIRDEIYRGRGA
ncbi:MAG: hypothetical protein HY735_14785 [Verrucomicrobia bacterium]|nr:hypothetical protein [Verrucomicrobiota bacterium]